MFSAQARRAMTTETRGQNSWVNFGRQNYTPEGIYKNIPAAERPYAVQKVAILPDVYVVLEHGGVLKWEESQHPRVPGGEHGGEFTRVAITSQRPADDPGHQTNREVFEHMRVFAGRLAAIPGVTNVSVKPGVGGWDGGAESMWQVFYRGNGEATRLVAMTAKHFNQDAVLILKKCQGGADCQPATELHFSKGIGGKVRVGVEKVLVEHKIKGWTWMKRDGRTILRMVAIPEEGDDPVTHQQTTAVISQQLRDKGLMNKRHVQKVAVSMMRREGPNSYDRILG